MPVTNIPPTFKAGAVGDVYRCSVRANTPFGNHVNTFHVRQVSAAPSGNIFADITATWEAGVKASYLAIFPASFILVSLRVGEVDDLLKGLPAETRTLTGAGTRVITGDFVPPQCAALLDIVTGFSGRRGRGRQFIGGIHETDQTNGTLAAPYIALVQAYGGALLTTFAAGTAVAELGIFTLITNSFIAATSTLARTPVFTQRRRRTGVGS